MLKRRLLAALAAASISLAASAQSSAQLTQKYAAFVGSEEGARTVVSGLREGADFRLGTTRFDPPTGKLGNGNVDIALALAQKDLAGQGVTQPTAEQLHAALIGSKDKPGVLQMRADGRGWGQIARSMGFKLGEVMRSPKASERLAARPERPARPEKPERPQKPERPEKPERPSR